MACVTGAGGHLGRILVHTLATSGWRVRAVVRHPAAFGLDCVEVVVCDAGRVWSGVFDDARVVFHLAAAVPGVGRAAAGFEQDNRGVTRHVTRAALAAGVERVVFFSSTAVYGPTGDGVADEGTVPRPANTYALSKLHAEEEIAAHPGAVILRLAAVYGPDGCGRYRWLAALARRGIQLRSRIRRTLVQETDAATAALLAATTKGAAGRVFNVTGGPPATLTDITAAMLAAWGRRRVLGINVPPMRFGGALFESSAIDGSMARTQLGFQPRWDLASGWAAVVAQWRARRAL